MKSFNARSFKRLALLLTLVFVVTNTLSLMPSIVTAVDTSGILQLEQYPINLALSSNGATATASHENTDNLAASKAIDGVNTDASRWDSGFVSDGVQEWLQIDFGKKTTFDRTIIYPGGTYTINNYTIQYSDDNNNWVDIASGYYDWYSRFIDGIVSIDVNFSSVTTSKVRILMPSPWFACIQEFEVYNTTTPTDAPTATATATLTPSPTPIITATPTVTVTATPTAGITTTRYDFRVSNRGSGMNQFDIVNQTPVTLHGRTTTDWFTWSGYGYNILCDDYGTPGNYASFKFDGTQIKLATEIGPYCGIASVSILDEAGNVEIAEQDVDLYDANGTNDVITYISPVLAQGTHTLKVEITGRVNANNLLVNDGNTPPTNPKWTVNLEWLEVVSGGTITPTPTATPPAPTGLTSPSKTVTTVSLSWTAATGATGYNVYNGTTKLTATPITATTYTATGLTEFTAYIFTVKAVNAVGESPASTALSVTTILLGDVTGDGKISPADALKLLQFVSGKITLTDVQTVAADVTKNGLVQPSDALKILQYCAGKILSFN